MILTFDDSQRTQITEGLPQLVRRNMTGTFFAMTMVPGKAFQLSDDPVHAAAPELTLRRVLVDSTWTSDELVAQLTA